MKIKASEVTGFEESPFASFLYFFNEIKKSAFDSNEFKSQEWRYIIVARLDSLIYLSSPKNLDKSPIIKALTEPQLTALRQNKSVLILDNSLEGIVFQEQIFEQFYKELNREKIDPQNIIILTENLSLSEYHEKWLYLKGYKNGIKIFFYHAFMNWMALAWQKDMSSSSSSLMEFHQNQMYDIKNHRDKDYDFLFLNNMPKDHRLLTALMLYQEKVIGNGLSSFANLKNPDIQLKKAIDLAVNNIRNYYPNNAFYLNVLNDFIRETPLIVDGESGSLEFRKNRVTQVNFSLFKKTHFSIVTESESTHGQMVRFTEKCLKPLSCCHPFVVIGNPFTLKSLRNFGFKTFSPYIDETYDEVCDTDLRFDFAINSILNLARMNKVDLSRLIYKLQSVLEHNFYHAVTELPNICHEIHNDIIKYIICNLSDKKLMINKNTNAKFKNCRENNDPIIGLVIENSNQLLSLNTKFNLSKPKLSIISHLNSSGGTVISKCIASMEKVSLLSEIHPWGCYLSSGNFHPLVQYLKWHDDGSLLQLIEQSKHDLISAKFSQIIKILENHASSLGKNLVIRDWSYIDFFNGAGHPVPYKPLLCDSLLDNFELHIAVTTRHPIDTWLSMDASGFARQISVDKFIFGYWNFAKYAKRNGYFKYEDFVTAPNKVLSQICHKLQINFDPQYANKWFDYTKVTGNSGRKSETISPRNRRKVDDNLLDLFKKSPHYRESLDILNYD